MNIKCFPAATLAEYKRVKCVCQNITTKQCKSILLKKLTKISSENLKVCVCMRSGHMCSIDSRSKYLVTDMDMFKWACQIL